MAKLRSDLSRNGCDRQQWRSKNDGLHRTIQCSITRRGSGSGGDSSRGLIDYRKEIRGAVAQLARAPALQAGGQGFDSLNLHHMGQ